jgi:glutamyl-tRNA synthetase
VEYDGTCLHVPMKESDARASGGESFIVRMKDPHRNIEQMKPWTDLVYGSMKPRALAAKKRAGRDAFNDAVLLKGDGRPTYHLANVVDDYYMKITHVVRGVEWLESTWQHVALYDALGWKPPAFAHVGLLMDEQKRKLSKRLREFDLEELKSSVLPETLMNFLALLGWKHKRDKEVFTMQMLMDSVSSTLYFYVVSILMLQQFDLDLNKTNPVVSLKKLYFLQPHHARLRVAEGGTSCEQLLDFTVAAATSEFNTNDLQSAGISTPEELRSRIDRALKCDISWISPMDFVTNHRYLFASPIENDFSNSVPKKLQPLFADRRMADLLEQSVRNEVLSLPDDWITTESELHHGVDDVVAGIVKEELHKAGLYATSDEKQQVEAMRVARHCVHFFLRQWLAGGMSGPGVIDLMLLLGPEVCRDRIELRVLTKDLSQSDHPKEAVAV